MTGNHIMKALIKSICPESFGYAQESLVEGPLP